MARTSSVERISRSDKKINIKKENARDGQNAKNCMGEATGEESFSQIKSAQTKKNTHLKSLQSRGSKYEILDSQTELSGKGIESK